MALRDTLLVLFTFYLYLRLDGVRAKSLEDLELDEELKRLNKPAVKTLRTIYGDVYNCIGFYEQPAFDHPSLKDHKYNYKMTKRTIHRNSSSFLHPKNIWLNGKGCPDGTVPIKKTTKDDLIRARQAAKIHGSQLRAQTTDGPGYHYAVVGTLEDDSEYNGAGTRTSVYTPQILDDQQFSGGHMMLRNGAESIEVGWIVHPSLYKDKQSRLFIHTRTQSSNCYNTDCAGFIHLNTDIPLDLVLSPPSTRGGKIYELQLFIYKDSANGDWFLEVEQSATLIGSWPARLFSGLSQIATYVEWGGIVYSPPGVPTPPMGSGGSELTEDTGKDAYCRNIQVVDRNHQNVVPSDLAEYTDIDKWYFVRNEGNVGGANGQLALFGGAGGYKGN